MSKVWVRVCRVCGNEYEALKPWGRICKKVECIRAALAGRQRTWAARNPERNRANQQGWQRANPERLKATHDRWLLRNPCPACGGPMVTNHATTRAGQLCRTCRIQAWREQSEQRRAVTCYQCARSFVLRNPGTLSAGRHYRCSDCRGSYLRAGMTLGISRERVRQLVNGEQEARGGTLAEALARVMGARANGWTAVQARQRKCVRCSKQLVVEEEGIVLRRGMTEREKQILGCVWQRWAARKMVTYRAIMADTGMSTSMVWYYLNGHPESRHKPGDGLVGRDWLAQTGGLGTGGTLRPGPLFGALGPDGVPYRVIR